MKKALNTERETEKVGEEGIQSVGCRKLLIFASNFYERGKRRGKSAVETAFLFTMLLQFNRSENSLFIHIWISI
jgi:hypothetical protein